MSRLTENDPDFEIKQFKIKKLIKGLERVRGHGTSLISLIIPPKDQISRYSRMLGEEYGTASHIKSRVTRSAVLSAITSTQQKLKLYNVVPDNGLVIYCGNIITEDGKEKKLNIDIEPHKPLNTSMYLCDSRFHVEPLADLLTSNEIFGFIIMDGQGTLFGTLCGNARDTLQKITVELPKKHGRGGQSAVRFSRLRTEKRHNYVRKIAEASVKHFIGSDNKVNVTGIVIGGLAELKNELRESDLFDPRLKEAVITTVDCSYGMENGFNQAINLAAESLSEVKYIREKKLLDKFFEEIAKDTGLVCYGIRETFYALENGAVEDLILYESLDILRYQCSNGEEEKILYIKPDDEDNETFIDKATGQELEVIDFQLLTEWFTEHYSDYGANINFVSDSSEVGAQFVQGFGGVGGILRYQLDFSALDYLDDNYDIADDYEFEYEWDF